MVTLLVLNVEHGILDAMPVLATVRDLEVYYAQDNLLVVNSMAPWRFIVIEFSASRLLLVEIIFNVAASPLANDIRIVSRRTN